MFDKRNIYTSISKNLLNVGDVVVLGNSLHGLEEGVLNNNCEILEDIGGDEVTFVFNKNKIFAYLVCPARNAQAYNARRMGQAIRRRDDKSVVDYDIVPDWLNEDYEPCGKIEEEIKEFRPFRNLDELFSAVELRQGIHVPSGALPFIWVRQKGQTEGGFLVQGFFRQNGIYFLRFKDDMFSLKEMFEEYTFLDGSCFGVAIE